MKIREGLYREALCLFCGNRFDLAAFEDLNEELKTKKATRSGCFLECCYRAIMRNYCLEISKLMHWIYLAGK